MSENEEKRDEEEILKSLDDETLLGFINDLLPENQKISGEKASILIPEAKKIFPHLRKNEDSEIDLSVVSDFFNVAKKDFDRSRNAYLQKDYPEAIYHLQQSVEKLVKAYGLSQGVFSEEDLRDISHKTPRAFIKMVEEEKIQLFIQSLKKMHPNLNTDIGGLKIVIDTKETELALASYEAIMSQLELTKKIEDALTSTALDEILKQALPILAELQGRKIDYPDFSVMKFSSIFIKMYILAVLTYPHEAFTRYPDKEIKPSRYDENLGIVKASPHIFPIIENAINFLEKFLLWKNENQIPKSEMKG